MRNTRKWLGLLLALAIVIGMLPTNVLADDNIATGYCGMPTGSERVGTNLSYSLNWDTGELTITGTGEMRNFSASATPPWWHCALTSVTVSPGVTSIGKMAFSGNSELSYVSVPDSVTRIGTDAFARDTSLKSFDFPANLKTIAHGAFYQCRSLEQANLPEGLEVIEELAFQECEALRSVTLPDTLTELGRSAFQESGLVSVAIPDRLKELEGAAFFECRNLERVDFGALEIIGTGAFSGCSSLRQALLPETVEVIDVDAFANCSGLTALSIPASTMSIFAGAFRGCTSLKAFVVDGSNPYYCSVDSALYTKDMTCLMAVPGARSGIFVIPDTVTWCPRAFSGCKFLQGVVFSPKMTSTDSEVFAECDSLRMVYLPLSVTSLRDAFPNRLGEIYYEGIRDDWEQVFGHDSDCFQGVPIHFNASRRTDGCYMVKMDEFGDPVVNGAGDATVFFRVEDQNFNPIKDVELKYAVSIDSAGFTEAKDTVISDGNGLVGVTIPDVTRDETLKVRFYAADSQPTIHDYEQEAKIKRKKASYQNTWTQKQGAEMSAGEDLYLFGNGDTGFSITDAYDNGKRTLTIKYTDTSGYGAKGKMKNDLEGCDITVTSGSVKGSLSNCLTNGVKIENYDPANKEHLLKIGRVAAYGTFDRTFANGRLALTCSMFLKPIRNLLWDIRKKDNNVSAEKQTASVKGGFDFLKLTDKNGFTGTLISGGGSAAWSWDTSVDQVKQTRTVSKSLAASGSVGIGSGIGENHTPDDSPDDTPDDSQDDTPKFEKSYDVTLDSYLFGGGRSYNNEVAVAFATDTDTVKSASFRNYTADTYAFWGSAISSKEYDTTVFSGNNAKKLVEQSDRLHQLAYQENAFVNLSDVTTDMAESGLTASVTRTHDEKLSLSASIPAKVFEGLSITPSISFDRSCSFETETAVLYKGTPYQTTSVSDETRNSIKNEATSTLLATILTEPLREAIGSIAGSIRSVSGLSRSGVRNDNALLKSAGGGLYTVITTLSGESPTQAVPAASLMEDDDDAPVGCLTVGAPYMVGFYQDEECTEEATAQQVQAAEFTLTLSYTDEMLSETGAADSGIRLYRFDANTNRYVPVPGSLQNPAEHTVSAVITKAGEYILGVGAVGPVVDNYVQLDYTLRPSFSVFVSDPLELAKFRCWLDSEENGYLITEETVKDYYDPDSGMLIYPFPNDLEEGWYNLYFQAEDQNGNQLDEPVCFELAAFGITGTLAAPETASDTITTNDPFKVTVQSSGEHSFSQVLLLMGADGSFVPGQEMEQVDENTWTVNVRPIPGLPQLQLQAVGVDDYGNHVVSDVKTLTVDIPTDTPVKNPFVDVSDGAFYYEPVLWAVSHDPQITNGTDATHFSPGATCTRGQVVTFLWRAMGCPAPAKTENPFVDVKEGAFYYKAVLWAVENGITNGVDAAHFGPDRGCTRAQVVTFLWRAEHQPSPGSKNNPFSDVTGGYYYDAVLWAVERGITNGTDPTHFSPDRTCTRGQIVTFLSRDMQ